MNRRSIIIAIAVIVVFSAFAVYAFSSSLNPYVTFAEAAASEGSVQVMGYLDGDIEFDMNSNELCFPLKDDEGTRAMVVYKGAKPNNMEHAESVVVAGTYGDGVFQAQGLLVKCPSKYQEGAEGE